jgi:hypothetical protein
MNRIGLGLCKHPENVYLECIEASIKRMLENPEVWHRVSGLSQQTCTRETVRSDAKSPK